MVELMHAEHVPDPDFAEPAGEANLHFITIKRPASLPADLLGSERMRRLMAELRRRYDFIVIDSPPAVGPTDVKLIGAMADAAVLVVQWDKTGRAAALNGLDALAASGTPIAGIVLNQVDLARHAKYRYGDVGDYYASRSSFAVT
jgi:Mrp family chromosome partitioning ATPase